MISYYWMYRVSKEECTHFINLFVEKINRAREYSFHHMKHLLRQFFLYLSAFHCTSTWASFVVCTISIWYSNTLKASPDIWGMISPIEWTIRVSKLANKWLVYGTHGPLCTCKERNPGVLNLAILQAMQCANYM